MATEEEKKAQAEQKKKEDDAAGGPAGIAGTVLSMASSIGGMIPSLLGGPQKSQLEQIQRGGGTGAVLARQAASGAGRQVAGNVGGRGGSGQVRAGIRSAENIAQRGVQQAAVTGAREGLAATQMLRSNDITRRNAFRTLGAGVGQGLAGIGGMLAAAKDQGPVQPGEGTDTLPGESALIGTPGMEPPSNVGAGLTGLVPQTQEQIIDEGGKGLGQLGAARTAAGISPPTPAMGETQGRFTEQGSFGQEMDQAATAGSLQGPDTSGVAAQQAANIQGLAEATAAKQDAADSYRNNTGRTKPATGGTSSVPPADDPTNPEELDEWLYNEAANFNPAMGQGMDPQSVLQYQMYRGRPIDWERLGIQPQENMSGGGG